MLFTCKLLANLVWNAKRLTKGSLGSGHIIVWPNSGKNELFHSYTLAWLPEIGTFQEYPERKGATKHTQLKISLSMVLIQSRAILFRRQEPAPVTSNLGTDFAEPFWSLENEVRHCNIPVTVRWLHGGQTCATARSSAGDSWTCGVGLKPINEAPQQNLQPRSSQRGSVRSI